MLEYFRGNTHLRAQRFLGLLKSGEMIMESPRTGTTEELNNMMRLARHELMECPASLVWLQWQMVP
jgi:hypothetical protein